MKTLHALIIPALALAALSGCSLKEKYAKNNAAGDEWLAAGATSSTRTNFEGTYYSPEWGMVVLNQSGSKINGAIDYFHVTGRVAGRTARLLLIDDQWVTYTMELKRKDYETLTGKYSPSVPFSDADSAEITMLRIER